MGRDRDAVALRNIHGRRIEGEDFVPVEERSGAGRFWQNVAANAFGTQHARTDLRPFDRSTAAPDDADRFDKANDLTRAIMTAKDADEIAVIMNTPGLFPKPELPIFRGKDQDIMERVPGVEGAEDTFRIGVPSQSSLRRKSGESTLTFDPETQAFGMGLPSEGFRESATPGGTGSSNPVQFGKLDPTGFTGASLDEALKSGTFTPLEMREGRAQGTRAPQGARAPKPVDMENATDASRSEFVKTGDPAVLIPKKKISIKETDLSAYTGESGQEFAETGDFSVLVPNEEFNELQDSSTFESWLRFVEGGRKNPRVLKPRPADAVSTLPERKFIQKQEKELLTAFRADTKPFRLVADKLRTFVGAFRYSANGIGGIPDDLMPLINSMPSSAEMPASPMADLAMIFSFMKVMDPESVVRENEQLTVRKATSMNASLGAALENALNGTSMNPTQRADMLRTMQSMFEAKYHGYNSIADSYRDMALRNGLNPDNIVIDAFGDIRKFVAPEGADTAPLAPGEVTDAELEATAKRLGFSTDTQDEAELDAIFEAAIQGR